MPGWGTPHEPDPAELLAKVIENWEKSRTTKDEQIMIEAKNEYRKKKRNYAY